MDGKYKILVDALPFDHGLSGISVYTVSVVNALRALGHDVTVLAVESDLGHFGDCRTLQAPRWAAGAIGSILFHLFMLPRLLRRREYDFCLVTAANRRFPASGPIPVIGTVHDLAQCRVSGKYDWRRTFYLNRVLGPMVRRCASGIVAISQSTCRDIEEFWRIPASRITVLYNGLSLPAHEKSGFLERLALAPGRYIFYVSRIEHPGKNHIRLMQAYEKLPPCLTERFELVMAGSPWKGSETVYEYARNSRLGSHMHFTGFVDAEELPEAYRSAALYVFPSCYEGFGLSLIEAMHYGCPCCCSDNSSLGEIGTGAALLFPAEDVQSIANAMETILEDREGIRNRLVEKGRERAMQFDWSLHAEGIVKLYERIIEERQA